MNILTNDFLSIEEVAIYLEKFGYKYDLEKQHEYKRLHSKIYDLNTQNNIAILFRHYGVLHAEIEEVEYDNDLYTGEPVRIPIFREINKIHTNAYYHVDTVLLKNILINEKQVEIVDYKTGNISKTEKYTNPKYKQTRLYAYQKENEGYSIKNCGVKMYGRKGNGSEKSPLMLTGEMVNIDTPYDRKEVEKWLEYVNTISKEISECYQTYLKIFK